MPRIRRQFDPREAFTHKTMNYFDDDDREAFRKRQEEDLKRWNRGARQRQPFHKAHESISDSDDEEDDLSGGRKATGIGQEDVWRNSEGERLGDFGVDEDVDYYDEDDVPLGDLLRKRREVSRT